MKRWMVQFAVLAALVLATGFAAQTVWAAPNGNNGGGGGGGGGTTEPQPTPIGGSGNIGSARDRGRKIHMNYDDIMNTVSAVPGPTA